MKLLKYILLVSIPIIFAETVTGQTVLEKVFVHTDRNIYVAGEDILYSFFLQENNNETTGSIVGYMELINNNNKPVAQLRFKITDSYSHGLMSVPDSLTTGIYKLRAYTRYMRNFGYESFYTQNLLIYNPFKTNIKTEPLDSLTPVSDKTADQIYPANNISKISTPVVNYSPRQMVTLKYRVDTSSFVHGDKCKLSFAVAVSTDNIACRVLEDKMNMEISEMSVETGHKFFYAEDKGPYLEGSVISRQDLRAVAKETLYLSVPGKNTFLQYAVTDGNGGFRFMLPDFQGNTEYIIQPSDFNDDILVKTGSPYANMLDYSFNDQGIWDDELMDFASRLGVNYQVNKIYDIKGRIIEKVDSSGFVTYRFYGIPDVHVDLDDYVDLPTMEEVFHELVPGVALRKQGDKAVFTFVSEPGKPKPSGPDVVFLDGVILDDPAFVADIDPELIRSIDVIQGEYQVGRLTFNGLVSISSYKGDMCGIDYPNAGLRTSSKILEREKVYQNITDPDSIHIKPNLPDFRNTLYWNPDVKPDSEGFIEITFYTSDFLSEYRISIEGITDKGMPVSYEEQISVSK